MKRGLAFILTASLIITSSLVCINAENTTDITDTQKNYKAIKETKKVTMGKVTAVDSNSITIVKAEISKPNENATNNSNISERPEPPTDKKNSKMITRDSNSTHTSNTNSDISTETTLASSNRKERSFDRKRGNGFIKSEMKFSNEETVIAIGDNVTFSSGRGENNEALSIDDIEIGNVISVIYDETETTVKNICVMKAPKAEKIETSSETITSEKE